MDAIRLGATVRVLRIRKSWRQRDIAAQADVTRSAVSRVERGKVAELKLGEAARIADALGAHLDLVLRWQGGDLDRLLNARHSALHESVARRFGELSGWEIAPEVSFSVYGERGVIDIVAWHAPTRSLLVIELKTEIVDVNELMANVDRKRRLAASVARERGWDARSVSALVIVAASRTNRRRVATHVTTLRSAFPLDGRGMRSWLQAPAGAVAALWFWTYAPATSTKHGLATVKRVRRRAKVAA